jgi:hypothetical protein
MNRSLTKVLPISWKRSDISQNETEAASHVKDLARSVPWVFNLIMESHSASDQDASRQPAIPSTQFARFLLMSRIQ